MAACKHDVLPMPKLKEAVVRLRETSLSFHAESGSSQSGFSPLGWRCLLPRGRPECGPQTNANEGVRNGTTRTTARRETEDRRNGTDERNVWLWQRERDRNFLSTPFTTLAALGRANAGLGV